MTIMQTAPNAQTTEADARTLAQKAAEDYFTAKKVLDALAKQGEASKKMQKAAMDTLAGIYPVKRDHSDAIHPITVFGNATATFLHREDDSVKWQKIAEGILPHLNPEQVSLFDNLLHTHTGTRTTRTLKR